MRTLQQVFDPRLNALNLVRLALALGVVLRHSFTMLGAPITWGPLEVLLRSVFVDGFFAISGYLIVSSWVRLPDWRRFMRARCLRILPGFWVCLLLTAFVFAPVHALLTGTPMNAAFFTDGFSYVWHNAALWIFQDGIAGGPLGADPAEAGTWNGSLWTLSWEFICYLGVLGLGLTGLITRRWVIPSLFVVAVAVLALTELPTFDIYLVHHASRFATMFLAGAVIYQFQHRLPAAVWLLPVGLAVVLGSAAFLPDYRLIGALPLAYVCIVAGAVIKAPALRLKNDLSYGTYIYAYPVQQLLVGAGLAGVGVGGYFLLSVLGTLPLAAASWFVIERPALRLKTSRKPAGDRAPQDPTPGPEPASTPPPRH